MVSGAAGVASWLGYSGEIVVRCAVAENRRLPRPGLCVEALLGEQVCSVANGPCGKEENPGKATCSAGK